MIHQVGTSDGWHGIIAHEGPFTPVAGRYHLYIGLFCPFSHRVDLVRHLCGLVDIIPVSIVRPWPKVAGKGLKFPETDEEYPGATVDPLFGTEFVQDLYFKADTNYKGSWSTPVLWDKWTDSVVSNESAEMLRWLPNAFDSILPATQKRADLYPIAVRSAIDETTVWMQPELNGGVYKAGAANPQEAYNQAVAVVFRALNKLEKLLGKNGGPFILGDQLTELDLRAYTTLIRFDPIYVQHCKCNLGMIRHDYPHIHNWLKNLYWNVPGFQETTDFMHIKESYTKNEPDVNPKGITPMGPIPNIERAVTENWDELRVGFIGV
ncbi:putative cell wall organization protein/glutathione transferase (Gto3) [Aspergillus clavatus NRRL 1]|uniref:Cell wall organization protein/glutathione transferase (Gto3), putative n=1 Tax=Aspergillus clavatus (strain ATCC 1007 / CBS 513.65 / DSM 816 / NCTC 3887 / NRRL 1 / QM 1276 / 107) TaxID=344612 RepID=A1CDY3_ASPCL|nr:cell wall organization protein/glutathione transferase (Gto3), putative [Aspergillus clavatus NRRL 1]EAW12060.1 cell wall organization protein/glutathione transferase (Gto3), putative [Aspergillus clavatus NRRL 1]